MAPLGIMDRDSDGKKLGESMITSTGNAKVKHMIQLGKKARERKKEGVFLVEGMKMFRETPRDRLVQTFVSESFLQEPGHEALLEGIRWEAVKDSVFTQMSDTLTPQGILSVVRQQERTVEELFAGERPLLLILEDLQDPGNVGTIFRTAEGAGVSGIIMTRNCVDIYHPKTVRATMGSIYRMPFLCVEELEPVLKRMKEKGIVTFAAHLKGQETYDREDYCRGTAFLIGNEGNGLSSWLSRQADRKIRIPMEGQLESLNASVAAAILMYEAARQRRNVT